MTELTITAEYRCNACELDWTPVSVPERASAEVNVVDWVKAIVGAEVQADHALRSPNCKCAVVDLKIPAPPGAAFIGQGSRQ